MQSDAAPQSVHSSCWTNGTLRRPLGKPSFLSAGKPSVMVCLVAMGGESLRAMAARCGRARAGAARDRPVGRWSVPRFESVGQVLLDDGQERDEERLGD